MQKDAADAIHVTATELETRDRALSFAAEIIGAANVLWPLPRSARAMNAVKGGYARAAVLSPERRQEIASKAATARWAATSALR